MRPENNLARAKVVNQIGILSFARSVIFRYCGLYDLYPQPTEHGDLNEICAVRFS